MTSSSLYILYIPARYKGVTAVNNSYRDGVMVKCTKAWTVIHWIKSSAKNLCNTDVLSCLTKIRAVLNKCTCSRAGIFNPAFPVSGMSNIPNYTRIHPPTCSQSLTVKLHITRRECYTFNAYNKKKDSHSYCTYSSGSRSNEISFHSLKNTPWCLWSQPRQNPTHSRQSHREVEGASPL